MRPDARERIHAAIERKNAERGRPLTDRERLDNLAAWLADNSDEDGLDPIEALVVDAAAAEPSRMVHEGGEYYAERIIRRAIAQGTLVLAQVDRSPEGQDNADWPDRNDESAVAESDAPTPCSPSDNLSGDGW